MTAINGVALVTGGGAGLGRACALTLAKRGARVAVHYMKSREGAEEVVAALKAAGTDAASFQADLTESADVQAMVEKVISVRGSRPSTSWSTTRAISSRANLCSR